MLSNHYPLAFATAFNWIIASLVFLMGVTIRHYFNTTHARKGNPTWTWLVTALLFLIVMWLSTVPKVLTGESADAGLAPSAERFITRTAFPKVRDTVLDALFDVPCGRAGWEGMVRAERRRARKRKHIALHAREIYLQAGRSHAMPPGNVTGMTTEERALIVAWFESAAERKLNAQ
jgi:uncharacterized membrane protein